LAQILFPWLKRQHKYFFRNVRSVTIQHVLNVTANMGKENFWLQGILNVHAGTIFENQKSRKMKLFLIPIANQSQSLNQIPIPIPNEVKKSIPLRSNANGTCFL
jgi:hypothetical protein